MRLLALPGVTILSVLLVLLTAFSGADRHRGKETPTVSANIVVSQVYGGGGNAGAQFTNDYIELFNRGASAVDVTGWSVQYQSATGTTAFQVTPICAVGPCLIQPGKYFLVQEAAGAGTPAPLPTPDATGTIAMSATTGRVAVLNTTTPIAANATCAAQLASVDFVGYGVNGATLPLCFEGAAPAPLVSNTTADLRQGGGCQDTDNNNVDFFVNPPTPRNSASPLNPCTAGNTNANRNKRANFDADTMADVSVWRPSNHNWYILQSGSGNSLKVVLDWGNPDLGDVLVPGDYDGDNKTDTAVFRPSENNWYIINSSTNTPTLVNWGAASDKPVPGDYDGDGKTDVAVFRPSEGKWYIRASTAGVTLKAWGLSTDIPIYGNDFDGDAKADLAVFRPSDNKWYILNSNSVPAVTQVNWGQSGDKLVPADYDGDGKADVAIYRPTEGNWYIRRSTGTNTINNWGNSTDTPVPTDYDGDNRADIAVWRPSEGNWYVLNSGNGTPFVSVFNLGISGDVPVPSAYLPANAVP